MITTIVRFHVWKLADPPNPNAGPVADESATARQKSEFLKLLAAAGF